MSEFKLLVSGDLVEISSWRRRGERPKVGVIVEPVIEAAVSDFSRYAVLIDDEVITIRRDRLHKIEKPDGISTEHKTCKLGSLKV